MDLPAAPTPSPQPSHKLTLSFLTQPPPPPHAPPNTQQDDAEEPYDEDEELDDDDVKPGASGKDGEPPKKKRRRQALSCTECKRRKIKCDRNHPCGPCTRRGEMAKCRWTVVEPLEKFVTRSEWDEMQRKVAYLESIVFPMIASGTIPPPPPGAGYASPHPPPSYGYPHHAPPAPPSVPAVPPVPPMPPHAHAARTSGSPQPAQHYSTQPQGQDYDYVPPATGSSASESQSSSRPMAGSEHRKQSASGSQGYGQSSAAPYGYGHGQTYAAQYHGYPHHPPAPHHYGHHPHPPHMLHPPHPPHAPHPPHGRPEYPYHGHGPGFEEDVDMRERKQLAPSTSSVSTTSPAASHSSVSGSRSSPGFAPPPQQSQAGFGPHQPRPRSPPRMYGGPAPSQGPTSSGVPSMSTQWRSTSPHPQTHLHPGQPANFRTLPPVRGSASPPTPLASGLGTLRPVGLSPSPRSATPRLNSLSPSSSTRTVPALHLTPPVGSPLAGARVGSLTLASDSVLTQSPSSRSSNMPSSMPTSGSTPTTARSVADKFHLNPLPSIAQLRLGGSPRSDSLDADDVEMLDSPPSSAAKGKGKAPASPPHDEEEDELASDRESTPPPTSATSAADARNTSTLAGFPSAASSFIAMTGLGPKTMSGTGASLSRRTKTHLAVPGLSTLTSPLAGEDAATFSSTSATTSTSTVSRPQTDRVRAYPQGTPDPYSGVPGGTVDPDEPKLGTRRSRISERTWEDLTERVQDEHVRATEARRQEERPWLPGVDILLDFERVPASAGADGRTRFDFAAHAGLRKGPITSMAATGKKRPGEFWSPRVPRKTDDFVWQFGSGIGVGLLLDLALVPRLAEEAMDVDVVSNSAPSTTRPYVSLIDF